MSVSKTKKFQVAVWVSEETDLNLISEEDWIRIGKSTTHTVNANPTTNTFDYIDQTQPETELERYAYSMDHDIATYRGNPDYEFAFERYRYADVGDASKVRLLIVFFDHENPAGVYAAFTSLATMSVSSADYVNGVINVSFSFNESPINGVVKGNGSPVFIKAPDAPSIVIYENKMTISSNTPGADIMYTIDGKNPMIYGVKYSSEVELEDNVTIKAVATKDDAFSRIIKSKFIKS